jgi:HTH-type transcriptional regulator/antitoxin HigA
VDLLRYLIEEHDLTLSELAVATGIKVSTLSEILAGKRRLNLQHVTKLARHFLVSPSLFIEAAPVPVAG